MTSDLTDDLSQEALSAALGARPLRSYAALVSTGSAAHAWAAAGAPGGAVVVAGQQISPRGHAGRPLEDPRGRGLGFSVVLRPSLPAAREGWLSIVALTALSDVFGEGATIAWPDEVRTAGARVCALGVNTRVEGDALLWGILDVLVAEAPPPRGPLLAAVLEAIDVRLAAPAAAVLDDCARVCETLGRRVRVRLRAGTAPSLEGEAADLLDDGALVLSTAPGTDVPVRPQDVGCVGV